MYARPTITSGVSGHSGNALRFFFSSLAFPFVSVFLTVRFAVLLFALVFFAVDFAARFVLAAAVARFVFVPPRFRLLLDAPVVRLDFARFAVFPRVVVFFVRRVLADFAARLDLAGMARSSGVWINTI
ncbi:MAG: hypothetical protein JSW50_12310 [Candidatus Latescibacterota bacterium]|nr:MAG: hypothetical protein JSW50_12310 [Candidatus Latescibacterota bacterium]